MFDQSLSIRGRRVRWGVLALALTPLMRVVLHYLGLRHLPIQCPFKWLVGVPSPGCGMTRSLLALTRGDWQQSFMYHLFGPFLFLVCIVVVVQTTIELIGGRSLKSFSGQVLFDDYRNFLLRQNGLRIGFVLFLTYYVVRLYARYLSIELPFGFEQSALWQWVVTGAKAL